MQVVTKNHLADFTEKLLENDKKIEDELNSKIDVNGDGSKFLSDDGTYKEITLKKKKPLTLHSKTKYFKGKNVLTGNVGSKISLVSNAYRDCYKVPISEDKSYIITLVRTTTATTSQAWIVTDASDNILAIGPQENVESSAFIPKTPNAAYLYFSTVGDKISTIYEYVENSDGVIYEGDKYKFTNSDITANSCTITSHNGASNLKFTATGGSATIQLPQDTRSSSVGIWVKLNTSEIKNLTQLNFSFKDSGTTRVTQQAGKAVLSSGGWHFIKVATYDGKINQLEISANFTSSFINVQIMNEILFDQYTMPSIIIEFDKTWKASEDCGLYDYLLNNKIPFTITGVLSDISENMKSKLLEAYNTGLVDLGLYGNEIYDGVSNPVSYQSTDYNELQQNLGKLLNKKLEYCEMPVSFGPLQHEFSNMLIDFISRNGFKVTKVPNTLGAISNAMFKDGQIICIAMKSSYTSGIQHDILHKGDSIGIFAHGVSTNPSAESEPSLYADWATAKAELDAYVSMRNKGLLRFENMKQVAERNGR